MRIIKNYLRRLAHNSFRKLYDYARYCAEQHLPPFANQPKHLRIELPRRLSGTEFMRVGDHVAIGPNSLLVAQDEYPSSIMQHPDRPVPVQQLQPTVVIGNRVSVTGNLTISAMKDIRIGDDVMIASNVIIMDSLHGFAHVDLPYKYQPMWRFAPVVIGRGCWIAQNVVIMPGVNIGEMSIVGANSVVTRSIPPYSIAFGTPARAVKRWDGKCRDWVNAGVLTEVAAREAAVASVK